MCHRWMVTDGSSHKRWLVDATVAQQLSKFPVDVIIGHDLRLVVFLELSPTPATYDLLKERRLVGGLVAYMVPFGVLSALLHLGVPLGRDINRVELYMFLSLSLFYDKDPRREYVRRNVNLNVDREAHQVPADPLVEQVTNAEF
uniref:Uncharacterized protein n=1 Tax=Solanum tuberosum TaxID=4113 RepID=M1DJ45_SOLTU